MLLEAYRFGRLGQLMKIYALWFYAPKVLVIAHLPGENDRFGAFRVAAGLRPPTRRFADTPTRSPRTPDS